MPCLGELLSLCVPGRRICSHLMLGWDFQIRNEMPLITLAQWNYGSSAIPDHARIGLTRQPLQLVKPHLKFLLFNQLTVAR